MAEVASAFVTLVPTARGFGKGIERELMPQVTHAGAEGGRRLGEGLSKGAVGGLKGFGARLRASVNKEADRAGKESGERLSSRMGEAFKGLAVTAAGFAGVDFFKDAISQASDLNESTTKIQAIFGDATGAVQQFAAAGGKALGQTRNEVLDSAASFGTFGKAAGLTGKDLAKFSTGFAGLSTDLASFFNEDPADAAEAIGSALRGEAEPMRRYGVLLDDATMRAAALRLGLIKTTKDALTPQQKVLAAQAVIYEQTKDAQGDFARTSGGLANQQRILAATFTDIKTNIGTALLPIVLRVASAFAVFFSQLQTGVGFGGRIATSFKLAADTVKLFIGSFTGAGADVEVPWMDAVIDWGAKARAAFDTVSAVVRGQVIPALQSLGGFLVRNRDVLIPIIAALGGMYAAFKVITAVVRVFTAVQAALNFVLAANPIGIVVVLLAGLVAGLVIAYQRSETFRKIVDAAWSGIRAAASAAWRVVGPILSTLGHVVGTVLVSAFRVWVAVVRAELAVVRSVITAAWQVIRPMLALLGRVIGVTLVAAFRVYSRVASAEFRAVSTAVRSVWNTVIKPVFDALKTAIGTSVPNAFKTGVSAIKTAWDKIKGYAKAPVKFVIETVLNHGILAAFNKVAGSILGKKAPHINSIPLPAGFAQGTEDHRAQIAKPGQMRLWAEPETGGEAYIPLSPRKRARSTQILGKVASHFGLGLTQFANGGTLVQAGKRLRDMGYSVTEGPPPFGPVHRVHAPNSRHYSGMAIDVNHGAGTSKAEQAALDRIVPYLKGMGLRVLWRVKDHFNHLHAEVNNGLVSRIGGALGGLASNLDPRKLINAGLDKLSSIPGAGSPFATAVAGVPQKLSGMLIDKAQGLLSSVLGSEKDYGAGTSGFGGAARWAQTASLALRQLGRPGSELGAVLRRIQFESGGNPNAVNLTDSNARAGHPSRGLMQVIPGTFNAYAGQYRGRGITDPLANIYAGANYALHRYGSLAAIDPRVRPKGYDQGGWLQPGLTMVENKTGKPEAVFNPQQLAALTGGRGGPTFNGPVYTQTPQEFARLMMAEQRLHEALHPTFG